VGRFRPAAARDPQLVSDRPPPGLTDYLLGQCSLAEALQRIEGLNLFVLPAEPLFTAGGAASGAGREGLGGRVVTEKIPQISRCNSLAGLAGDSPAAPVVDVGVTRIRKAMICQRWTSGKCAKDGMPVVSDPLRKIQNNVPGAA
jgi:hypothetical protein